VCQPDRCRTRSQARRQVLAAHSDETLTTTDIALGYKALYEVEPGWRDAKSTIDQRPAYH